MHLPLLFKQPSVCVRHAVMYHRGEGQSDHSLPIFFRAIFERARFYRGAGSLSRFAPYIATLLDEPPCGVLMPEARARAALEAAIAHVAIPRWLELLPMLRLEIEQVHIPGPGCSLTFQSAMQGSRGGLPLWSRQLSAPGQLKFMPCRMWRSVVKMCLLRSHSWALGTHSANSASSHRSHFGCACFRRRHATQAALAARAEGCGGR